MSKVDGLSPGIRVIPLKADGEVDQAKLPPVSPYAFGDWFVGPRMFAFKGGSSAELFDSSVVPTAELKQSPAAFGAYVREAFEANAAYFQAPDGANAAQKHRHHSRIDSFIRESVGLAHQLFPEGLRRDDALGQIESVVGPSYQSPLRKLDALIPKVAGKEPSTVVRNESLWQGLTSSYALEWTALEPWSKTSFKGSDTLSIGSFAIGGGTGTTLDIEQATGAEQAKRVEGRRTTFARLDGLVLTAAVAFKTWDETGAITERKRDVVLDFRAGAKSDPQVIGVRFGTQSGRATEILIDAAKREVIEREFEMRKQEDGRYQRFDFGDAVASFRGEGLSFEQPSPWFGLLGNHDEERSGRLAADFAAAYQLHLPRKGVE